MRLDCRIAFPSLLSLALVVPLALAGCGGESTPECQPKCPEGYRCTLEGCVSEGGGGADLSAAEDMARTCTPACAGKTPYCNASFTCVPCLTDEHCPAGQVCKSLGNVTTCVPGCADDNRCGGGTMKCCGGGCIDTSKDVNNCGACGTACSGKNTRPTCAGGVCMVGACTSGWGDCNNDPADGCEANLNADAKNCTACGTACNLAHAISDCGITDQGKTGCLIRSCDFGWDDCDANAANGCELNVLSNNSNCGSCGAACKLVPHAKNNCINGTCQLISCDANYADCNKTFADGCEISTGTDANNCGACGNKCGQGLICVQGGCTCPQCNLPNAKSACVNLVCAVAQCNVNWGDCDNQPQNGCERNLTSDAANCGACGKACAQGLVCVNGSCTCPNCVRANARTVCVNNVCQLDQCFVGFGDCNGNPADGCEVDFNTSNSNCGACGKACPNNNVCLGGVCQAFRSKIMLCGTSGRPISVFVPQGMMFNSVSSCAPDNDTQAIFLTRSWNNGVSAQTLQAYLMDGGVVLTEYNISHTAYNAAFGTNAAQGARLGGCDDTLPCTSQFSPNDPFWQANNFQSMGNGCGYGVESYPGITPLCGWNANNASVGYRDLGNGRFYATDFDWQDNQAYAMGNNTIALMGYMMTHRR